MSSALPGVYAGIVVTAEDPQNRGRARLRIPQIMGTAVTGWAEPAGVGIVSPGDQVTVSFDGQDRNYPVFWPMRAEPFAGPWVPLVLESGWSAGTGGDGPPVARVTGDGMIELSGVASGPGTIARGTNVQFATLPEGMVPLYDGYQTCATNYHAAYNARQVMSTNNTGQTTTSTSYVELSNGPAAPFIAPGHGEVFVRVSAWVRTTNTTDYGYMTYTVLQGSTVIVAPVDERAAVVTGTTYTAVSMEMWVSGLTPGVSYTAASRFRCSTSAGATFDTKRVTVTPTFPLTTPNCQVGVLKTGAVTVLYPNGSPSSTVNLSGLRVRAI